MGGDRSSEVTISRGVTVSGYPLLSEAMDIFFFFTVKYPYNFVSEISRNIGNVGSLEFSDLVWCVYCIHN